VIELAIVLLVDRSGRLLVQLRDGRAPTYPGFWCLPGGHCDPGETASIAAVRELWEEAGLVADDGLRPFARQELSEPGRVKYYFYGSTCAQPEDIVVGEGEAMVFLPPADVLDGRPLAPGTEEMIRQFIASAEYATLGERKQ
jgi:8-oxo-dGTP diphosphatase